MSNSKPRSKPIGGAAVGPERAAELYRSLLVREESAAAHFGLGQCLGKLYDFDAALTHLDRAFALDPARSEGASYYAYVLERHGRMDDADRWYRHALAGADADDLWARSHHAWFLEKWGRTHDACGVYEDVLRRNPSYTWAVKRYALLLHRLGRPGKARALLRDTVDWAPGNRFAALNYLEYLLLTGDTEYPAFRSTVDSPDAGSTARGWCASGRRRRWCGTRPPPPADRFG